MDQGDLRRSVQPHWSEGGADPSTDVEIASLCPVKPLGIRGPQVCEAQVPSRQAQFHLASVIVAGQGEGDPAGCGAREDLRAMGQENRRDTGVQTGHSLIKVRTAGAHVIDSGNGKRALLGLNHLMGVVQERDAAIPENRLEVAQLSIPMLMISQGGEGTVTGLDTGHLLKTARKEGNRGRDEVARKNKQIRLERCGLVGVTPDLLPGHENTGMEVGELDHTQRAAKRHSEFLNLMCFRFDRCPISGKDKGHGGNSTHPGLQKTAAAGVRRIRSDFASPNPKEPHNRPPHPEDNQRQTEKQPREKRTKAPDRGKIEHAILGG